MDISTYQPGPLMHADLERLVREKYGAQQNFDYFLNDLKKAHGFCADSEHVRFYPIAGFDHGKMQAHIALIIDARLPRGEAFFGFLEMPESILVYQALWSSLVAEARQRGISLLKGPVNGSIWHQYRVIKETDGSPFLKSELFCEPHYYRFLASGKPENEILYYSARREPFDIVLSMLGKESYDKAAAAGFSVHELKEVTPQQLETIATISKAVFKESWGYTELTAPEFLQLYSSEKLAEHLSALHVLYHAEELIGFCSTARLDERTIMCKTIGIVPQYQGMGLGNALAYRVHADAQRGGGFTRMIYALIREGNNVKNFPQDTAVIFRRYAAFDFRV